MKYDITVKIIKSDSQLEFEKDVAEYVNEQDFKDQVTIDYDLAGYHRDIYVAYITVNRNPKK